MPLIVLPLELSPTNIKDVKSPPNPRKSFDNERWGVMGRTAKTHKPSRSFRKGPEKKPRNKKHISNFFKGLSRDYPRTVPKPSRHFPEIFQEFCLCVALLHQENRQHINKFDPHPLSGQSRRVVYVYCFFSPGILSLFFVSVWGLSLLFRVSCVFPIFQGLQWLIGVQNPCLFQKSKGWRVRAVVGRNLWQAIHCPFLPWSEKKRRKLEPLEPFFHQEPKAELEL